MKEEEKKVILLVEDEEIIASAESLILGRYGYEVIVAETGEKAIEIVDNPNNIDLVLMDINLGLGIDGTVAAEKILEKHDIPIIFLSSHTESEIVEKTEGITSYGYLVKNTGKTVLLASLKMAFRLIEARKNEKKKEEALRKERDFAESLVNTAQVIILVLDPNGTIVSINPFMENLSGYSLEEVKGKDWISTFLKVEDHTRIRELLKKAVNNTNTTGNINPIILKDGSQRYIEWYDKTLKDAKGEVVGLLSIGLDITKRKKAEDKIQSLLEEKEILLKEVHHRINNNMNVISSLLTMQSLSIEDPEVVKVFQDAIARVESMGMLYDKLYRSENYRHVSIEDYLSQLTDDIYTIFPDKKNIIIEKELDNFDVKTDIVSSIGILVNELLTNSMKHAFSGKKSGIIRLKTEKKDNHIRIIYEDNGSGLINNTDEKQKGFGLMLLDLLTKQIGGYYKIERDDWTRFIIEFEI